MSVTHEVAWAAGFFDGEGYVTIQHGYSKAKSGKCYRRHSLRVGINHVAIEPLLEMQRLFGGEIEKQILFSVVGNRKPRHRWVRNCSSAAEVLKRLMPYLKNKREVAEIGLELQATMQEDKKTIPEEMVAYRQELREKIIYLNQLD